MQGKKWREGGRDPEGSVGERENNSTSYKRKGRW